MLRGSEWDEYVDQFYTLYISYTGRYAVASPKTGQYYIPKKSQKNPMPKVLGRYALAQHLEQEYAVAIYCRERSSKFLTFDVDDGAADTVKRIVKKCTEMGIPKNAIAVSFSGNKGFHVDIFFDELISSDVLYSFYLHICDQLGLDTSKVEFRPTHGQAIKLPLSVHYKTGKVCWYLDTDTLEPIENRDQIFAYVPMTSRDFNHIVHKYLGGAHNAKVSAMRKQRERKPMTGEKVNGVVDGEWANLTASDTRHNTMVSIASYERLKGKMNAETLRTGLQEWVKKQNPDFIESDSAEIDQDIDWIVGWAFGKEFNPSGRTVTITPNDITFILSQGPKYARKFGFLVLYFTQKLGEMKMSHEFVSNYIGCSRSAVQGKLINQCIGIKKHGNGYRAKDGRYRTSYNSYWCGSTAGLPETKCAMPSYEVTEYLTAENFDEVYYTMLAAMLGEDLKKYLSRAEYKSVCILLSTIGEKENA